MIDISKIDYSVLDRPEVIMFLFHPRPEPKAFKPHSAYPDVLIQLERDVLIPVDENVHVGARFHMAEESGGNILFFHGNGEIVSDYDELGPVYNQIGINFLAVDYRGYGRSTGQPSITAMMRDCHVIFDYVKNWLKKNNYPGPLILMGRSLGSASVLELAAHYQDQIDGLIIESGFAYAGPLLQLLGIDMSTIGFKETEGFRNIDKMKTFDKPTLIIHAERDHIIPFKDGQALHDVCPSSEKTLLKIPAANHNDIFSRGLTEYLAAIKKLADRLRDAKNS
jgi:fermentation-respiration switch protein FrsA (DUF1100 family)